MPAPVAVASTTAGARHSHPMNSCLPTPAPGNRRARAGWCRGLSPNAESRVAAAAEATTLEIIAKEHHRAALRLAANERRRQRRFDVKCEAEEREWFEQERRAELAPLLEEMQHRGLAIPKRLQKYL